MLHDAPRPLFREALAALKPAVDPDRSIFEGPSALAELLKAMDSSGLEPVGLAQQFIRTSGLNPRSGLALEFIHHV